MEKLIILFSIIILGYIQSLRPQIELKKLNGKQLIDIQERQSLRKREAAICGCEVCIN